MIRFAAVGRRILVLFAHPVLERSRVNRHLADAASAVDGVTLHDLYEAYPSGDVDVEREQSLLLEHDVVVWQHPFYWYSVPALLKEWADLVLEHGWAYGAGGDKLRHKIALNAVTTGGPETAYRKGGYNRFTMRELLSPWDQTATLCGMTYLAPFVVHGSLRVADVEQLQPYLDDYRRLLDALRDDHVDLERAAHAHRINDDLDAVLGRRHAGATA
jgi:glutathione-regulated potassium-efflux system ancillary protein KefG